MKNPIRRTLATLATAALAAGALTACGQEQAAEFDDAPPARQVAADAPEDDSQRDQADDSQTDRTAPEQDGADQASEADAEGQTTGVPGPEDAVATIAYEIPDRDLEITVGLHSLEVHGEVMRLDLSFTPEGPEDGTYGFYEMNRSSRIQPVLNDRDNLKQYSQLRSAGTVWGSDTSHFGTRVSSGQTLMFYGYYAAPEDEIDTVDITVIDGLVEFTDAPIQW